MTGWMEGIALAAGLVASFSALSFHVQVAWHSSTFHPHSCPCGAVLVVRFFCLTALAMMGEQLAGPTRKNVLFAINKTPQN
jgi:hypothetical protein